MKAHAHLPLQLYTRQLTKLFRQSSRSPNPALFLYRHKARGPLFMAESITRLLCEIHNDKPVEKALHTFKKLEDLLGKIDDDRHFVEYFSKRKKVDKACIAYYGEKRDKIYDKLNKKLRKNDFYLDDFKKFEDSLEIDFNKPGLVLKLQAQIKKDLEAAYIFYKQYPGRFTDMSSQVHELRRKLRWMSIYSQSLQGLIILKPGHAKYKWPKAIVSNARKSPYNKLPGGKNLRRHIVYDQQTFYALNFVVDRLGRIKDKGMEIEALAKAIKKTCRHKSHHAEALAIQQLQVNYTMESMLKQAHSLMKDFFMAHKGHKKLV